MVHIQYLAKCPSLQFIFLTNEFVTEYVFLWGKCDITCILFTVHYIDVFAELKHWLSD